MFEKLKTIGRKLFKNKTILTEVETATQIIEGIKIIDLEDKSGRILVHPMGVEVFESIEQLLREKVRLEQAIIEAQQKLQQFLDEIKSLTDK